MMMLIMLMMLMIMKITQIKPNNDDKIQVQQLLFGSNRPKRCGKNWGKDFPLLWWKEGFHSLRRYSSGDDGDDDEDDDDDVLQ